MKTEVLENWNVPSFYCQDFQPKYRPVLPAFKSRSLASASPSNHVIHALVVPLLP